MQNVKREVLVVGLGNPGLQYSRTLHNIGFKSLEKFANHQGWRWKEEPRFRSFLSKGSLKDTTYHLLCPATYMNLSGEAVFAYLNFLKLRAEDVVVVLDDADLPLGEIRLRSFGGTGGHNGLKSLTALLGTDRYKRIRIGIGRPLDERVSLADYVLAPQSEAVWTALEPSINEVRVLLEKLTEKSFEDLMKMD